jgi:hypothetical protein
MIIITNAVSWRIGMSDGHSYLEPNLNAVDGGSAIWRDISPAAPAILQLHRVVDAMPQLGTVLWMHRREPDRTFPRARLLPEGVLLLEHPALMALADCVSVIGATAVTSLGPHEWLEFRDAQAATIAKLYLLPDADYLAWDSMLSGCRTTRASPVSRGSWHAHSAFMCSAFARVGTPWQAQIVRLPMLRLIGLRVLGLRSPDTVSSHGERLAHDIAGRECALMSATS